MNLVRIFASTLFELLAVVMLMPLITLRLAQAGEPAWLIGAFGASLWLAIFAVTPFAAHVTKRFGMRATYVLSGFVPLASVSLLLQTEHRGIWISAVGLLGLAGGLRWVTAEAYVAEAAPPARRGSVIGAFETMVGATFVIGPLLLKFTGIDGPVPLLVSLGMLIAALVMLIGLEDMPSENLGSPASAFLILARAHPGLLVTAMFGGLFESGPGTFLPIEALAMGFAAANAALVASVLGLGSFVMQVPVGYFADRGDLGRLLRGCLWITLGGALLLPGVPQLPWLLWLVAFVWGGAGGGIFTLAMIKIGHSYSGVELVGATASLVFAYSFGSAVGPAFGGIAIDLAPAYGFSTLMGLSAITALVFLQCLR